MQRRINPPPPPSLPREAPWREIEEIIELLKVVAAKLAGVAEVPTVITPSIIAPAAPADLKPITDRLDLLILLTSNKPTFATGQKTVDTHGKPVQLDDVPIPEGCQLTLIAKPGNGTAIIYVGTKAGIADTNRRFDGLSAGIATSLHEKNANVFWVDSSADGAGVSWIVEQL